MLIHKLFQEGNRRSSSPTCQEMDSLCFVADRQSMRVGASCSDPADVYSSTPDDERRNEQTNQAARVTLAVFGCADDDALSRVRQALHARARDIFECMKDRKGRAVCCLKLQGLSMFRNR